jgi:periplasmic protein TonB
MEAVEYIDAARKSRSETPRRPPYRPPIGIPTPPEPRVQATVASALLHALVFILILAPPIFVTTQMLDIQQRGAGGPGPVGGGGGGNQGTGGQPPVAMQERVRYIAPQPPPVPVEKSKTPDPVKPPVKPPEKKLEEPKREVVPPPIEAPKPDVTASTSVSIDSLLGTGGGTGKDGTAGSGPGSGGGIGSGIGPGRGSGMGPGTGGGDADIYPPTVVTLSILPLPIPAKVRPYKMTAVFEVDSLGNAKLLTFNPSKDGGYNRRIRDMLAEIRFRPAVTRDGRPVRDTAVVTAEAR